MISQIVIVFPLNLPNGTETVVLLNTSFVSSSVYDLSLFAAFSVIGRRTTPVSGSVTHRSINCWYVRFS
uniref:Uncharacterized protein n=1 Tax=Anguilla anguilla TaxID=7936 RepID=A0A0E9WIR0_ANGAN